MLDLRLNKITDQSCDLLVSLLDKAALPHLVVLYVDKNGLSEEALEKLALAAAARGLSLSPDKEEEYDSEEEDGEEEYDEDEYGSEDEDAW